MTNNDCPAEFRYEYDEEVRKAIEDFSRRMNDNDSDDTLLITCPVANFERAFELYYREFFGTRDVANRVLVQHAQS